MKKKSIILPAILLIMSMLFLLGLGLSEDDDIQDPNIIVLSISSEDLVGKDYETVISELKAIGFTDIKTEIMDDLIFGWLTKDGEVELVDINGKTEFSENSSFPKDAKIVVTYHTFPEKDPEVIVTPPKDDPKDPKEDPKVVVNFPQVNAFRAAVVAFTNRYANDIFHDDGNTYDLSKFHSYADVSGFVLIVDSEGTWSAKNENTWHVDYLLLRVNEYNTEIFASLDVSYDGENYIISNLKGRAPSYEDISVFENESDYSLHFIVPPELIKDDRAPVKELREYVAQRAFEIVGETLYPYGFKCHWFTGLEIHQQYYDGSWYFKVKVTITNQFGASRKATASGYINNTTEDVENFRVE